MDFLEGFVVTMFSKSSDSDKLQCIPTRNDSRKKYNKRLALKSFLP